MLFYNRAEAGKKLAKELKKYKSNKNAIVLGLPRGGVIVAYEVAKDLDLPLDIVVPRKIGAPNNEEFAIGAITETGEGIFDETSIKYLAISEKYLKETVEKEKQEAQRRLKLYRGDRPVIDLTEKIVILVDDGIATGSTMLAACKSVKVRGAKKLVVAVAVTPKDTVDKVKKIADEFVYLYAAKNFMAVGQFYNIFEQTTDEEVIEKLREL